MSAPAGQTVTEIVVIDEETGEYVAVHAPDEQETERLLDAHPALAGGADTPIQMGI